MGIIRFAQVSVKDDPTERPSFQTVSCILPSGLIFLCPHDLDTSSTSLNYACCSMAVVHSWEASEAQSCVRSDDLP